jgi:hypothetical protein
MTASITTVEGKVTQLIKEYSDDGYCLLELLRFMGRHPHTRFSRLVIIHALNSQRLYTERAIRYLANKGVVRTHIENNVLFYSLTEANDLRDLALNLAALDWYQWQALLRQVYPLPGE